MPQKDLIDKVKDSVERVTHACMSGVSSLNLQSSLLVELNSVDIHASHFIGQVLKSMSPAPCHSQTAHIQLRLSVKGSGVVASEISRSEH